MITSYISIVILFGSLIAYLLVKGIKGIKRRSISVFFFPKIRIINGKPARIYSIILISGAAIVLILLLFLLLAPKMI